MRNIKNIVFYLIIILFHCVLELEKTCYDNYMTNIEASIVKHPKAFWTFVKSKRKAGSFPNEMFYRETFVNEGQDINNLFASYFQSTFLEPESTADDESTSTEQCSNTAMSISTVDINHSRVLTLLKSLDLTNSGGPDLIPPLFIDTCAHSLAEPITILFKRSVSEGKVPKIWKSAFVSPIFKKAINLILKTTAPFLKSTFFLKFLNV
ncbi:hypothetical protein PYW07_012770 [Mythimna separata]|uniref:Reverse transcriptase domain-containing protein n=1 Tax=Mythimna separata TaxID=271217 RepID=A0AAD7Y8U8_MYTSE|nr:hypothetical protein PYW07_012770 [Mythimna separata]